MRSHHHTPVFCCLKNEEALELFKSRVLQQAMSELGHDDIGVSKVKRALKPPVVEEEGWIFRWAVLHAWYSSLLLFGPSPLTVSHLLSSLGNRQSTQGLMKSYGHRPWVMQHYPLPPPPPQQLPMKTLPLTSSTIV